MSEDQRPLPQIDYSKFRLSLKRLEEQYDNYKNAAVNRLPLDEEGIGESVIQRFETCYNCLWKVLRRYLIDHMALGNVPNSPNPVFRLASQNDLLRAPVDQWLMYAQKRIDTSHDYDGEKAQAALEVVPAFIDDAVGLYQTMTGATWE